MAGRRLLLSMFLGAVLFTGKAGAWDVFNVYAAKAPEGCLDKNIAVTKEVSPVSYTHLDVYKRQRQQLWLGGFCFSYPRFDLGIPVDEASENHRI